MQEPEEMPAPEEESRDTVFMSARPEYNVPGQIVTLRHYYPKERAGAARDVLKERSAGYVAGSPADSEPFRSAALRPGTMRRNLGWTQLINSLNAERQWLQKVIFELLDPVLEPDIALAAVPTHMAHQAFWPLRALARELAAHRRHLLPGAPYHYSAHHLRRPRVLPHIFIVPSAPGNGRRRALRTGKRVTHGQS